MRVEKGGGRNDKGGKKMERTRTRGKTRKRKRTHRTRGSTTTRKTTTMTTTITRIRRIGEETSDTLYIHIKISPN